MQYASLSQYPLCGLHVGAEGAGEWINPLPQHPLCGLHGEVENKWHLSESLPQHPLCGLHAGTPTEHWNITALPQHPLCGLHEQGCTKHNAQTYEMCCEPVHSFSNVYKATLALTIFPSSSAAKAIYITIIGSLGRAIDRNIWCEPHRDWVLTNTSPDTHAGERFGHRTQSLDGLVMLVQELWVILLKCFLIEVSRGRTIMLQ